MRMPSEIEEAMHRLDRAAGQILERRDQNRWNRAQRAEQDSELLRASLSLLNKIRRHN